METERFSDEEITARAQQLADEQGPGWEQILSDNRVGTDSAELRYWRGLALQQLEAEQPTFSPTVLEVEDSSPKTLGLD